MTFELTVKLTDEILKALENQEEEFLIDAKNGCLIKKNQNGFTADEENYYKIPEWTSAEGYKIRDEFTQNLHSPAVQDELLDILQSGRGVFKNFKNTLKKYPEVDRKWHIFKNRIMKFYINDWYNELRELWGLEKLDCFPESDENLVHDVNAWLRGEFEDSALMEEYAPDCSDEPIGVMCLVPVIPYLKKKGIID